ncbi:uncharacterized protein LOC120623793 [Pararge aegeria]|nr:uncharacterized protein LOC120623793 [Pararge aegeria]
MAACQSFMSKIIGIFTTTTAGKLPGMDVTSDLMKTSGEIIAKPIEIGQGIVKGALKVLSPPSDSPAKAPTATKDTSGGAKPDIVGSVENIGQNVVGSVFKAFGLF